MTEPRWGGGQYKNKEKQQTERQAEIHKFDGSIYNSGTMTSVKEKQQREITGGGVGGRKELRAVANFRARRDIRTNGKQQPLIRYYLDTHVFSG